MSDLVLDSLATYRLARLITVDDLTEPLREKAVQAWNEKVGKRSRLIDVVTCPHCLSVWVAFGVVFIAPRVVPGWRSVRLALASAGVAAVLFDVHRIIDGRGFES